MDGNAAQRNFTIDQYVNPWIPRPPWAYLPYPVAHFLGYRSSPRRDAGYIVTILWAAVGVFTGLLLIEITGRYIPSFQQHDAPVIIGSFGAAAVLEFYAIDSPLAQPRNAVFGQLLASIIGVGIRKLFEKGESLQNLMWLGGSVSCALATAVMALTGTVHPPAGATALLAVVDNNVAAIGWFLLPVILLGCVLMQIVALLLNNVHRRFPLYWWSPEEVGYGWSNEDSRAKDTEKNDLCDSSRAEARASHHTFVQLVVSREHLHVPETVYITPEEFAVLEALRARL
ncbi:hypothetical protein PFICI_08479 [Pestalotiopsis fici W106-1]|uniref:HPP transmembrane region domain-containing protein n=1 Tax=Pestalotiopsis fici (strain W106-1 / CGMCC3.15140) TaxID=1229662 RepID=W3X4F9_PESFW|nr:uncharacterized protein PFICI_08479 [Pestalotiopsis fici W106-1]ETS80950.1 hypothetical protein PFICI_08479 [Pestalotiopsis fici W106-1]